MEKDNWWWKKEVKKSLARKGIKEKAKKDYFLGKIIWHRHQGPYIKKVHGPIGSDLDKLQATPAR